MGLCIVGSYADPHTTRPCMGSHPIQRTSENRWPTVEHMGIDHCRVDIARAPTLEQVEYHTRFQASRGGNQIGKISDS